MAKRRNTKHEKRVKRLILGCGLCAIILSVSTYAWFIGMKTVNVSSFDVEIAAIDSLSLSLDGKKWADTVSISKSSYNDPTNVYANHTNSWGGEGLIPMSTVGKIDKDSSRMILFEKGSLTTTPGGYRLMASQVKNGVGNTEQDGYVAFDLFIKNLSGNAYYKEMNQLNEEAIYLTTESKVSVAQDGGVENTGIENSVRVAFAQIGRVVATTTSQDTITGITCTTDTNVTGICEDRDAQIWEPNDTAHVQNAINWYNTSCRKRTGVSVTDEGSYSTACKTIENGKAYNTYAVSGVIGYEHNVDVYDGVDYNEYGGSTAAVGTAQAGKLVPYKYFTDSMKMQEGVDRPTFITLAPNSITKVRVYIYIEGQDVDNYDFASLGKKISVEFGFTKERFFGEDIKYNPEGTATLPDDVIRPTTPAV